MKKHCTEVNCSHCYSKEHEIVVAYVWRTITFIAIFYAKYRDVNIKRWGSCSRTTLLGIA